MDGNSGKNVSGMVIDVWRSEVKPIREKVVYDIMEKLLKDGLPSSDPNYLTKLKKVAQSFEMKIYLNAKTKEEYIKRLYKKMEPVNTSSNQMIVGSSSSRGPTQTILQNTLENCSSLHNISGFSPEQPSTFTNTQFEMPGSQSWHQLVAQPPQNQRLQNQCLKQLVQHPDIKASCMRQNISYIHQNQQQRQMSSQATQAQTFQQMKSSARPHSHLMLKQENTTLPQQNQQYRQQSRVSQQHLLQPLPAYQHDMSNSFQELLVPQTNMFGAQQQQKMVNLLSDDLNVQQRQHAVHILQQAKVADAKQNGQQTSQPLEFHQLLSSPIQSNSSLEFPLRRLQTSASLHQSQNIIDQKNDLHQSLNVLPETSLASVESTPQTQLTSDIDWYDHSYKELLNMRAIFLPNLMKLYKIAQARILQEKEEPLRKKWEDNTMKMRNMINVLLLSRSNFAHYTMERFAQDRQTIYKNLSVWMRNSSPSQCQDQNLQSPGSESTISQTPQWNHMQHHLQLRGTSTGSSPPVSTQRQISNLQINILDSHQSTSQLGSERKTASSPLQHCSARFMQHIAGGPHQTKPSSDTDGTLMDILSAALQPRPTIIPSQHLKQRRNLQMIQPQKLKEQVWQHLDQQNGQQVPPQNTYEVNASRVKQLMGESYGILQQYQPIGQPPECFPLSSLIATTTLQHQSSQNDHENSSPFLSAETPLQSVSSPFGSLSSVSVEIEKSPTIVSPLSLVKNISDYQTPPSGTGVRNKNQSHSICATGLSSSPLLSDFTGPEGNQQLLIEQPIERLLRAVNSISSEALSAAVQDIGSVVSTMDRCAGKIAAEEYCEDLTAKTGYRLQARNFIWQYGCAPPKKMKRHFDAMTLDPLSPSASDNDSIKQLSGQISDLDSSATSRIKRRKIEPNALLDEIRDINRRLVETVIELDLTEEAVRPKPGEGTVIRCSYNAVAFSENLKILIALSEFRPLHIHLLIPFDYPNSSPIILDKLPADGSKESEDLWEKAKSKFSSSLHTLSQPISIEEIARSWDVSARAVLSEYSQNFGGETFSSRYGTWEHCVTAS